MRSKSHLFARAIAPAIALALLAPVSAQGADEPEIATVAGGVPSGRPATEVSLTPSDVDVDADGNLYIADVGSGVIWKRTTDGVLHHVAGSGRLCIPDVVACYGDGGDAKQAFLHAPSAIQVAPNGDVYVAERRAHRVRRIDASTGRIHHFAGNGSDIHADELMGGPAVDAGIPHPLELVFDSQESLFIGSSGKRIYRVAPDGTIDVAAGCGSQRFPTCWQGQDAAPVEGTMVGVDSGVNGNGWGMAVDPNDDLLLMDWSRILRLDRGNQIYRVIAGKLATYAAYPGEGEGGPAADARIWSAVAMAFAPNGDLFFMEGGGPNVEPWNRIQRIEAPVTPASIVRHVGGAGTGNGFAGDGGNARQARFAFSQPSDVSTGQGMDVGPDGTVYVTDVLNNRVRAISPSGTVTTVAGNGFGGAATYRANTNDLTPAGGFAANLTLVGGHSGDGGPAAQAQLFAPADVETDREGNLFVLDRYANRVRRIDARDGKITTVAGAGCVGVRCPFPYAPFEDHKPATQVNLGYPVDLALDRTGTQLYLADRGYRRVRQVNLGKKAFTAYPTGPKPVRIEPGHIATVLGEGVNIPTPGAIWGPSYSGCGLVKPYCGDGLTWDMWSPGELQGVATDSKGNLYASDARSNQVVRVDASLGLVELVAGVAQTSDCKGDTDEDMPGRATYLCGPTTLLVTPDDSKLYIVESGRQADLDSIQNIGMPSDVASRVRSVDLTSPVFLTRVLAGAGTSGFGGDGGQARQAAFAVPHGIALAKDGSIFISDTGNHRIRRIAPNGIVSTVAGSGTFIATWDHSGCGFAGDGGPPAEAELCAPLGIDVGPDGTLYVADPMNNRIRAIRGL